MLPATIKILSVVVLLGWTATVCTADQIDDLKREKAKLEKTIEAALVDDSRLAGGLVKSLIAVRLEVLRTNVELIRQRIHGLEAGSKITITLSGAPPDPRRAEELAQEIRALEQRISSQEAESAKYSGGLVVEGIKRAQSLFPWLLRGADFDNDTAFMNDVVVPWCRAQKIEVTRSRAYKKNDQAFVEQKNGAVVRRLVGYGRFEGVEAAQVMARLYAAGRLYVNFFQPSFKLKEKRREGAKVIKHYHPPATPFERAVGHPKVGRAVKARLRNMYRALDPVALLAEMRAAQTELGERIDCRPGKTAARLSAPSPPTDAATFASVLGRSAESGELRGTHRRPKRTYVRRAQTPSMLDPHVTTIDTWLAAEPQLTALAIVGRLSQSYPEQFCKKQHSIVQRLLRALRRKAAEKLTAEMTLTTPHLLPGAVDGAAYEVHSAPPTAPPAGNIGR